MDNKFSRPEVVKVSESVLVRIRDLSGVSADHLEIVDSVTNERVILTQAEAEGVAKIILKTLEIRDAVQIKNK